MIIPCVRCGKKIDTPDEGNADYITAPDLVVSELREVMVSLREAPDTLAKKAQGLAVDDSEYEKADIDLANIQEAHLDALVAKLVPTSKPVSVQKTGIVCPECYKPTDTLIWGIHKKKGAST